MERMFSVRAALVAVAAAGITAACGSGISVRSDYDPGQLQTIQAYQTYAWLQDPSGADRGQGQLVQSRVVAAVDAELAKKGLTKVASDPDFRVGWHVSTQDKTDVQTYNDFYGYGYGAWGYGGPIYGSQTYVRNYTEGTLMVDVVDAGSNQLVWRGAAEGEVDVDAAPEERTQNINSAVAQILADFPPGG